MTDVHTPWRCELQQQGFFTVEKILDGDKIVCINPSKEYKAKLLALPDILKALEMILSYENHLEGAYLGREVVNNLRAGKYDA